MAASLAAEIVRHIKVEPRLVESRGGVFEVKADGKLIFSKKQVGRFPEHEEVLSSLRAMRA